MNTGGNLYFKRKFWNYIMFLDWVCNDYAYYTTLWKHEMEYNNWYWYTLMMIIKKLGYGSISFAARLFLSITDSLSFYQYKQVASG